MAGRGPDRQRRKQRPGKIRDSAAEEAVRACLLRGGTLAEAAMIFRDSTGESVSKDSLSRYWQSVRAEMERELKARLLAEAVAERARSGRAAPLARQMLQAQLLEAVAALPGFALGGVPAERLVLAMTRLDRVGR